MENKTALTLDLTQGPIPAKLIRFTLPIMLANAFQVAFNLVDMFFIGHYAGTDALSAVSIGGQLTTLMFSFFMGVATAGQICTAQAVGSGQKQDLNRLIGNTITLSVLLGAVLTLIIPLAGPVLRLMNTPETILQDTVRYVVICSTVNVLISIYNGLSGVLRGMGDSRSPTVFVAIATVINIVLDYLFIAKFHWGVAGAAWANILGQSAACIFALVYLYRHREEFGFDFQLRSLMPSRRHLRALLSIGTPIASKTFFINGSLLFVSAQINSLGVLAVAVTGISQKIQHIMSIISMAMNDGTASMVGQSFAAGDKARVRSTVWCATGLSMIFCIALIILFLAVPQGIFSLFTDDPEVLAMAPDFMKVCCLAILSLTLMCPTIGLINGVGNAKLNLVISVIDGVAARLVLAFLLGYTFHMGALGFFLGNTLAGYVTVIWGEIYFLSNRWERRRLVISK